MRPELVLYNTLCWLLATASEIFFGNCSTIPGLYFMKDYAEY